ncbi:MAG: glycosyltransferase family 4 protein [Bryobacteraceae bacterium]
MRIALFDYRITSTNPIGGCHRRVLEQLANEHQFTVFAVEFANPMPDRIKWVRIPVPMRPLALLFIAFHIVAPIVYYLHCWRRSVKFDLIQCVESNLAFADVRYVHFCHRRYLKSFWRLSRPSGFRRIGRWLDYKLHAVAESWLYRRPARIVTPSAGLARELREEYPYLGGRIDVISNPIDLGNLDCPPDFDRPRGRALLGLKRDDCVLAFVALGHFERKALPSVIDAIGHVHDSSLKVLIVGGTEGQVRPYRQRAAENGIAEQIVFCGMQSDVKRFLWMADGFILPSHYETFSLVAYEAAAAALPLIVSKVHGVDEIANESNAILVEPREDSIADALRRFSGMNSLARKRMGALAREAVQPFGAETFLAAWCKFYDGFAMV